LLKEGALFLKHQDSMGYGEVRLFKESIDPQNKRIWAIKVYILDEEDLF
jgi:hypothetical protein